MIALRQAGPPRANAVFGRTPRPRRTTLDGMEPSAVSTERILWSVPASNPMTAVPV